MAEKNAVFKKNFKVFKKIDDMALNYINIGNSVSKKMRKKFSMNDPYIKLRFNL